MRSMTLHVSITFLFPPAVQVSFYPVSSVEADLRWIPNRHYTGFYPFAKLAFPELLPEWLSRVIVLDADAVLATDIAHLWSQFR